MHDLRHRFAVNTLISCIEKVWISNDAFTFLAPFSDMSSFLTHTGICLQYQSFCNWQWRGLKVLGRSIAMKISPSLAGLLEAFFVDRLMRQRQASRHTVAAYRDTFCLLLKFAQDHLKKAPSALTLDHLDAPFIGAFLDHIEKDRGNSARSRNARLAAIHSFFHYAALQASSCSGYAFILIKLALFIVIL